MVKWWQMERKKDNRPDTNVRGGEYVLHALAEGASDPEQAALPQNIETILAGMFRAYDQLNYDIKNIL